MSSLSAGKPRLGRTGRRRCVRHATGEGPLVDRDQEDLMTEQPIEPHEAADEPPGSRASTGRDVERTGGGRTGGEASVDEAMGAEDETNP